MTDLTCTPATIEDVPEMVEVARRFLTESSWGWTFNEYYAARSFVNFINHPECEVLNVKKDGKILATAMIATENDFQDETVGDVSEFYVMPESRGTGAGRKLLEAACEWFDSRNCVHVFVKSTGNIGQSAAFENLFKKYGFEVFSHVLVRSKNG